MITINLYETDKQLSELLQKVNSGEEVVFKNENVPIARLIPFDPQEREKRPFAGEKTSDPVSITEGAFEPLSNEELKNWGQ